MRYDPLNFEVKQNPYPYLRGVAPGGAGLLDRLYASVRGGGPFTV